MKGNKYELYCRNNLIERYSDKYTVVDDLFDERTIYHKVCIKMRDNITVILQNYYTCSELCCDK